MAGERRLVEQPVLSALIPRADIARLHFDYLDPSEAMENFLHRGDFKASRKTGAFEAITPLTPADLPSSVSEGVNFQDLLTRTRRFRNELRTETEKLRPQSTNIPLAGNSLS